MGTARRPLGRDVLEACVHFPWVQARAEAPWAQRSFLPQGMLLRGCLLSLPYGSFKHLLLQEALPDHLGRPFCPSFSLLCECLPCLMSSSMRSQGPDPVQFTAMSLAMSGMSKASSSLFTEMRSRQTGTASEGSILLTGWLGLVQGLLQGRMALPRTQ